MTAAALTVADVTARYEALQARIARAGGRHVTVVAVTKAFGPWAVDAAAACGIGHIAENYAQELAAKLPEVTAAPRPLVHFVGRLQRNKVKLLAGRVDVWQTVDRPELAREVARRAPGAEVMVQVNISHEETKAGCLPAQTERLAEMVTEAGLSLIGLMGIGPLGPPENARSGFRTLRRLVDTLGLAHCSMGMTDDLEVAVAEGATMVRIGRSLFGERPHRGTATVTQ